MTEEQQFLRRLAKKEIEAIQLLQQPVVRVCGPLTCDGPEGYQCNADRLERAETVLKNKGLSVWKFAASEDELYGKDFSRDDIMDCFHRPVLESGRIEAAYFLPRWQESKGATEERRLADQLNLDIQEFPEGWFEENGA